MFATSELSSTSLARKRAARESGRHARHEHLRFERHADHVIGSGVERVAQLARRVERRAHDDVDLGQLAPTPHCGGELASPTRARDHDRNRAIGQGA